MFNNIKITLHYSVYIRISGEKVRIPNEAERFQSVSHSHVRSLSGTRAIYSGVFKAGNPNLFTISYHLGTPYCQRVPLLPEQLI